MRRGHFVRNGKQNKEKFSHSRGFPRATLGWLARAVTCRHRWWDPANKGHKPLVAECWHRRGIGGKKHLHLQIRPPAPRCGRFRSGGLFSGVVFLSGSRGRVLAGHEAGGAKAGHSRLSGPRMPFRGGRRRHTPQLRRCSESSRGTSGAGLRRTFLLRGLRLWVVREEASLHIGARTSGF